LTSRKVKAEENETHDTQIQTGAKHNIWQFGIPSVTSVAVQKTFDRPYWVKYTNAKYDTQISSYFSKFQKAISNTLKEFFALNPLSQFMDEINPLAQLTQKRRLTSLGPGGVTREAGLAVRDIHPSYYGRICPIETPEGKNAGLVNSLSTHCRVNTFGFLQTGYVQFGRHPACNEQSQHKQYENWPLVRHFTWLTSEQEQNFYIVADTSLQSTKGVHNAFDEGHGFTGYTPTGYTSTSTGYPPTGYQSISSFATQSNGIASDDEIDTRVTCRYNQCVLNLPSSFIDFSSVSTISIISVATSLIPFLEHDDGNRALMGSNMQRQGVPLFTSEKAIVGTGIEGQSARDCRSTIRSEVAGKVSFADCSTIEICHTNYTRYSLPLFQRTNQNTLLSATPRVYQGEYVRRGDLLADTSCTNMGELSIGKNLYLGYMPWEGYNFEDAIVITEGVEDSLTSVHVQKVKVSTDSDEEFSPPRFTSHGEDNGNENLLVSSIKDFISKIPIMAFLPMKVSLPLVQDSVFGTDNERRNWYDYNTIHTQCTVNEVVTLLYQYQNIGYNEDSIRLHLNS
jgi:DNA-directed RNA polymerase subunit beta